MKADEKTRPWRASLPVALALLLVAVPGCRPSSDEQEAAIDQKTDSVEKKVDRGALSEWQATLEEGPGGAAGGLQVTVETDGLRVNGGPGGMLWRDSDLAASGEYRWTAEFLSPTGGDYGVLVGGKNLTSPDREYTSFLVRPSGDYRIERREGDKVRALVDWTPIVASATPAPAAGATTTAGPGAARMIGVTVDNQGVQFRVDGAVVKVMTVDEAKPYGLAGLRLGSQATAVVKRTSLDGLGAGQKP